MTIANSRDLEQKKFKKALAQYAKCAREHRATVIRELGLVPTSRKPKLDDHLRAAMKYQIPNSSMSTNPLVSIGKASAVSKTVAEVLALIGLPKRTHNQTGGRKPGSKNRYSSINLGR
jgi:hypothetical protein